MWLAWGAYWLLLSRNVKATTRREPWRSRLLHILPLLVAGVLLSAPYAAVPLIGERIVPSSRWAFWAAALLCAAGLLFSVWARVQIGRNWSGVVTLKQDHELVTHGPYAIVRHPIYTGLLLALLGSALARGTVGGMLGFVIAFLALWRKLTFEEAWMREQFGDAYAAYSARVAAIVPFIL
ncbi:MAG: isoprenylcysteine carboxylmethyltransferase family protein [Casimicrobiaceae bacterium]